jgi:hypothetical protein
MIICPTRIRGGISASIDLYASLVLSGTTGLWHNTTPPGPGSWVFFFVFTTMLIFFVQCKPRHGLQTSSHD